MPAHPVHIPTPRPFDDSLLDEEFDIFEITPPHSRKPGVGRLTLVCDSEWDEFEDDMESLVPAV